VVARKRQTDAVIHINHEAVTLADAIKAELNAERGVKHSRAKVIAEALVYFSRYRMHMAQAINRKLRDDAPTD
jgi:hypothetical protein